MLWLTAPDAIAPALPACWLIATGARPRNRPQRSALRHRVARDVLARQLGCAPDAITIGHEAGGRPLLLAPERDGLQIALATRDGVVALALAEGPVGVDVERVDPALAPPLAVLHEQERQALAALPEAKRPLAFARLWAAKEAYVKALGTGFAREPARFAVHLEGPELFRVEDPELRLCARGHGLVMKNGGHGDMAAAVIVLRRAVDQPG
jgi:4'-phosphopantetheinyl transferase